MPDFPYESHFRDVSGYRLHYIDTGVRDAPVILFLHGVPTWSYTFRKIIPQCVEAGYRVVAPDLPGFGLSEKAIPSDTFSLNWLSKVLAEFMEQCQISNSVLFAHDWGGVIGLMQASLNMEIFSGIILCNSLLPWPGMKVSYLFKLWRFFARFSPVLPVGLIVNLASKKRLTRTEIQGYNYPFHSATEKKAIRIMPRLLPFKKGQKGYSEVVEAWSGLSGYKRAVLTLFSNGDPITRGGEIIIHKRIPGTRNQAHKVLNGGHFIQEDAPVEIANAIIAFMKSER